MNFFQRRRMRQMVQNLLREARHARNMTEDMADPGLVEKVRGAEAQIKDAWKIRDESAVHDAAEGLVASVTQLYPPRTFPRWREN
ncbi:MAG: hypothetical protein V2A34_03315, partial [Lentisphaerota bacterium]